jgi:Tripartite tricarboxylate transporter TctB family
MEPLKMKEKLKLTEVWFKLVLLAFFGVFSLLAIPYPEKSKQFPQLIAVFSLVMIVISLMTDFIRKGKSAEGIADVDDTELKVLDATTQKTRRKRFYKAWGIILVSTATGFLGGFLFTTFFLLMGFPLFFGERVNLFKNVFLSVFMTMIIFFSFQWIMGVPLLEGILSNFLFK